MALQVSFCTPTFSDLLGAWGTQSKAPLKPIKQLFSLTLPLDVVDILLVTCTWSGLGSAQVVMKALCTSSKKMAQPQLFKHSVAVRPARYNNSTFDATTAKQVNSAGRADSPATFRDILNNFAGMCNVQTHKNCSGAIPD